MTDAIARHRTAMTRAALSRPVACALADGVLSPGRSVFDYGCGKGDDLRNLAALGYEANGWDPAFRPGAARQPSDVVNIGYVVNVIEDQGERAATLRRAWNLTQKVLVVAGRLSWDGRDLAGRPHGDGVVTRTGTFQKFYEQSELSSWIRDVLGTKPVAAAPGIFYVFREATDAEQFLANRAYTYRPRIRVDPHAVYEAHEDVLAPLLEFLTLHARPPRGGELDAAALEPIREIFNTIGRAVRLIYQVTDADAWEQIRIQRRSELLVYIAMSRFGRRPRVSQLGSTLATDIKANFGTYQSACIQADRLLLACGDPAIVLVSARSSKVGKQTPSALYVHRKGKSPGVVGFREAVRPGLKVPGVSVPVLGWAIA